MIHATYILLVLAALFFVAAVVMVFKDHIWGLALIGAAALCGFAAGVVSYYALNRSISPAAYRAVRLAAGRDDEVDAAAQWALGDNEITPSEYAQIAEVYKDRTGKDMNDLLQKGNGR